MKNSQATGAIDGPAAYVVAGDDTYFVYGAAITFAGAE